MFIHDDINKDKVHLNLNQSVTSHYEIEDFRDFKSVEIYLKELIDDYGNVDTKKESKYKTSTLYIDNLTLFEDELNNDEFESLMYEMSLL